MLIIRYIGRGFDSPQLHQFKENVMIVELGIIFAIYGIILIFALVGWIFETVLQYIANTDIWRK